MVIVFAILLFSLLIFLHELGHFVAAKLSKVRVNEFSIFMGPALLKWQRGETLYAIRCIPIGGYCAMEGEDEDTEDPHSFQKASWWKRLIILVAGSAMNFLAGLLLFAIVYAPNEAIPVPVVDSASNVYTIASEEGLQAGDRILEVDGIQVDSEQDTDSIVSLFDGEPHTVVVERQEQTVTIEAFTAQKDTTVVNENGLHVGDEILEIDGETVYIAGDFSLILSLKGGDTHDIVVERNGQEVVLDDLKMPKYLFPDGDGRMNELYGLSFASEENNFGNLVGYVWNNSIDVIRNVRMSLQMLLSGQAGLKDMSGPVGIVPIMSDTAQASESTEDAVLNLLYFGAFIAINLAVMNMLPIPALDGGRVVCLLLTTVVEKITRKKINPKYEGYIHGVGMILLLILMAVIMFKDVWGIFAG